MLAEETPARFVAFDLLAREDERRCSSCRSRERRAALEAFPFDGAGRADAVRRASAAEAEQWLHGAEGVIAKELDAPYQPGRARRAWSKIKRVRTIDAVVIGWRPGKEEGTVGSLILGLYDEDGELRVVGHTSGLQGEGEARAGRQPRALRDRRARQRRPEPLETRPASSSGSRCGPSWSSRSRSTTSAAGRIRHGAKFQRWREDKPPRECTIEQLSS